MGICYLCGNKIRLFSVRTYDIGALQELIGQIPSGMTKSERVCYTCFKSMEKRKKSKYKKNQPAKAQITQTKDETQFWVCPNCGGDTQMKDNRQYCPSCKIYLSI